MKIREGRGERIKEQREDGKEKGKWGKRGRSYLKGFYLEECCQLRKEGETAEGEEGI